MRKELCVLSGMLFALSLGAELVSASAAEPERVIVNGPYTVHETMVMRRGPGLVQDKLISVEQQVSYADLDMSKASDVETLKERVKQAAADDCKYLMRHYFPSEASVLDVTKDCLRGADRQALARVAEISSSPTRTASLSISAGGSD